MTSGRARLWTRSFILGLASTVAMAMVFFLLLTVLAPYTATRFGGSTAGGGFASSSFLLGTVLARLACGKYLDFVGRRPALLVSTALQVACCLGYLGADSYGLLITLRMLHGFMFGVGNTALVAGILAAVPEARRAEGTGFFSAAIPLGTALGPLLGAELLRLGAFTEMFWLCAGLALLALLLALPVRLAESRPTPEMRAGLRRLRFADFIDRATVPVGLVMTLLGLAYAAILSFANSYAFDQGFAGSMTIFFVVYAAAVLVARLSIGRIQDMYPDNRVVIPAILCFAAGLAVFAALPNTAGVVLTAILVGLGYGAIMPAMQIIAINRSPLDRLSQVTSTFFLLLEMGNGLGPLLLGFLIPQLGFRGMYVALAVLAVLTIALYWLVHGRGAGRAAK